ncbi:hypothetical protein [Scytonema sp. NUACC21]
MEKLRLVVESSALTIALITCGFHQPTIASSSAEMNLQAKVFTNLLVFNLTQVPAIFK